MVRMSGIRADEAGMIRETVCMPEKQPEKFCISKNKAEV